MVNVIAGINKESQTSSCSILNMMDFSYWFIFLLVFFSYCQHKTIYVYMVNVCTYGNINMDRNALLSAYKDMLF